jgi:hypothetical protein
VADVHVLDEAQDVAASRKMRAIGTIASSFRPRLTTMFTFTGSPAAAARRFPSSTAAREVDVVHRAEDLVVERVEADRDAPQPGVASAAPSARAATPFVVSVRSSRRSPRARDQALEVAADERLAAGDPDLLDAVGDERAREPLDLLEGEQLARRGSGSRARRPPSACSRRSGSCSGR